MQIVYFLEWDIYEESGVLHKVKSQVKEWRNSGHSVKIITVTPLKSNEPLLEGKILGSSWLNIFKKGFFRNYLNKILQVKNLRKELRRINPDVVYWRQGIWYPGLSSTLRQYNTVMELNTKDITEIKFFGKLKSWIYLFGREKIINSISALVAVSEEIGELYRSYKKPIQVIANGIDLSRVQNGGKAEDANNKNVIFVGSAGQPWHGVDKYIHMAKLLPQFTFHLVGPLPEGGVPDNLKIHGFLDKEKLQQLYKTISVGVGSLAFHRNLMEEGCPLKVREYIAYKIPVILGYHDTDMSQDSLPYVLQIENNEENVKNSIDDINDFITSADTYSIGTSDIERLVATEGKEKRRIAFFESTLKNDD